MSCMIGLEACEEMRIIGIKAQGISKMIGQSSIIVIMPLFPL